MDCPSHHPNPTSGGTCRDPTLVAVDYCQNIRSIFLSYRAETPRENTLQCHSLTTERSHPGSAWMVCVCVYVWSMTEIFALHLISVVPPSNLFNIDAPSTGRSAQWVEVADCSDWLQSEASLVHGRKTTKLGLVRPWAGSVGSRSTGCSKNVKVDLNHVSLIIWGELSDCTSSVSLSALALRGWIHGNE